MTVQSHAPNISDPQLRIALDIVCLFHVLISPCTQLSSPHPQVPWYGASKKITSVQSVSTHSIRNLLAPGTTRNCGSPPLLSGHLDYYKHPSQISNFASFYLFHIISSGDGQIRAHYFIYKSLGPFPFVI